MVAVFFIVFFNLFNSFLQFSCFPNFHFFYAVAPVKIQSISPALSQQYTAKWVDGLILQAQTASTSAH
jgi:hypothetical protein